MKRRIFAMLLVLSLVFAMATGVSAAETGNHGALSLDVTQGKGSVTINVYLSDCEAVTNGSLSVKYNADVLTLAEVTPSEAYAMNSVNGDTAGTVSLAWVGSQLTADSTLMLTLVLETDEGITQDMTYTAASDGIYVGEESVAVDSAAVTVPYASVDKSALEKAVTDANGVKKSLYTAASYKTMTDALAEAREVLADGDATQAEVDAAAKKLSDAIKALVPVKTDDKTESDKGDGSADTGDNTPIAILLALLLLAVAGVAVLTVKLNSAKGKKATRFLSIMLIVTLLMTMVPGNAWGLVLGEDETAQSESSKNTAGAIVDGETGKTVGTVSQIFGSNADLKLDQNLTIDASSLYDDDDMVRVLVELVGDSLLEQGYTQNQISSYGKRVARDAQKLKKAQNVLVETIQDIVEDFGADEAVTAKYHYTVALNGISITVPYGTLAAIRELPGVKGAYIASEYLAPESVSGDYGTNMYATSESFGSSKIWKELGYTGQGMTIAIIDTGLDTDHPSFADAPEGASLSLEDIENVLTELNSYKLYAQSSAVPLTADKLYYSEKIPYGFNYVDASLDVTHDYDDQGDHGSHVAGIACANRLDTTSVVGVAPDAQVVVMKVFGQNGGAFSDDIIAAIEDCILMDIDVINMSLGSQAGFSEDSQLINDVYGRILESDMLLAVAAGNSNSSASGNTLGTNVNLAKDPDNGLVNSPATYLAATTVASLENTAMMMPYFSVGDSKIAYVDVTYFDFAAMEGTYEYVVIPGVGDVSDYEGLNVQGKVALVQRGTIDFAMKQEIAFNMGAAALVVYDNVDGDLLSMYNAGFLPNVFITKADGEKMIAAAVNGVGTMQIHPYGVETAIPNSLAGLLSDFSCWGVTPDLQLTPDVTAPGGNIYSCYTDGAYGTMSGTSMASPHIAGMSALVLQYLHDIYPDMTDAEYHTAAEALIMCTAVPVFDPEGILYSPRKQGAGSANVYSAISSPAYLTSFQKATGELTPKGSLGDDPDRTGVFTFSFDINNMSEDALVYTLDGSTLTDQYIEYEGQYYMSETGRNLTSAIRFETLNPALEGCDVNEDSLTNMDDVQYLLDMFIGLIAYDESVLETADLCRDGVLNTVDAQLLYEMLLDSIIDVTEVTVPANSSVTVNVTVTLSDEDKAYMDAYYENGIYVDGFVRLYARSEKAVDLCLPFVGFYGDWTDSRMFDNGWYYDAEANDDDDTNDNYYNRYLNVVFGTLGDYTSSFGGLGINPYILEDYDPEHNVLSPNGDTYYDFVPEIYVSLMRSAELLDFTWTDDATGQELFYEWYAYARKSYYWTAYGMCMPAIYTDGGCAPFTFYDENGQLVVDDLQHLTLTIRGYLDDGDLDALETNEEGDPVPNTAWADDEIAIPVVIDLKAPTMDLNSVGYYTEDGRNYVTFQVEDNYDIAAVVVMTVGGGAYDYIPVTEKEKGVDGEKATITVDITDYDAAFQVVLCDYGCNESYYQLVNNANDGLAEDTFYGFRRYSTIETQDTYYATDALNGWYSFQTADKMMMHTAQGASGEPTVYAAEYVDGYIFGAHSNELGYNSLFVMKAGSWERCELGDHYNAMRKTVYAWPGRDTSYFPMQLLALDMTYDYTTGTMYILANALENSYFEEGEVNILMSLDLATGETAVLGKIESDRDEEFLALTLACDNSGNLYTVNYNNGQLYSVNKTPEDIGRGIGVYTATSLDADGKVSYYPAAYTQSMTFDHKTDRLYWAAYQGKTGTAYFIELDKTTGEIVSLTATQDNAELSGLFLVYDSGRDIIPETELTGLSTNTKELFLNVGQNATLTAMAVPYNADLSELTWSSSDAGVATVTQYGIVQATGIGVCTVTVSCGDFSAACTVNVSEVSGTLYGYSGDSWLLMDAAGPDQAIEVADAMEVDGTVTASAYSRGWLYVASVEESFDAEDNLIFTTNFYKFDPNTLSGILIGSYSGNTTALAYNYADGFLYGLTATITDASDSMALIRINTNTAATATVTNLDSLFSPSDFEVCSGALAIDYEGSFYVNGSNKNEQYVLYKFRLNDSDALANVESYAGFSAFNENYSDSMLWSESNKGIIRVSGTHMEWVDVSDMSDVTAITLGTVRSQYSSVVALAAPLSSEPAAPAVSADKLILEETYTVPAGETVKVSATLEPWNAIGEFIYEIADESVATVDESGTITGVLENGVTTVTVTDTVSGLSATAAVKVVKNPGYLYGFAQADLAQGVPLSYWIKMPLANTANGVPMTDGFDFTIYAAEYYNGVIYAYGQSEIDSLYYVLSINVGSFTYQILAQGDVLIRDMAFDYTTGTMYAIASSDIVNGGLYVMDTETAELTFIGDNQSGAALVTLACDNNGVLYTSDESGKVYTLDSDDVQLHATGITGPASRYLQSMTYDFNNDALYWAVGGSIYQVGDTLNRIGYADVDSGELATMGCIVSGLFSVPKEPPVIPEAVEPEGVVLAEKNTVAVGETLALNAVVMPVSVAAVDQTLTWSSSNTSIATVDAKGVVTGVKAGTAYITATDAKGHSDSILITVTAEHRYFYGYDEITSSWVKFDENGTVLQSWPDAAGLAPITAAQYIDGTLFAYDANGYFYTVDTTTFTRRRMPGSGISNLTVDLPAWDSQNGSYYAEDVHYRVVDMTYTKSSTGSYTLYAVLMAYNISEWQDSFSYKVVQVNMMTGSVHKTIVEDKLVDNEMSLRPTNLIYRNGSLYTINGYITGMVTKIDPVTAAVNGTFILANYWGDFNGGRSLIEDPLTGTVYAIRDMRTDYIGMPDYNDAYATSELCTMNLGIARCDVLATVGSNMRIVGMFIK